MLFSLEGFRKMRVSGEIFNDVATIRYLQGVRDGGRYKEMAINGYGSVLEDRIFILFFRYMESWIGIAQEGAKSIEKLEAARKNCLIAINKIIACNPYQDDIWITKGAVTLLNINGESQDEKDAAAECFINATKINPENIEAWHSLGTVYLRQKEYKKAEKCFIKILKINPENIEAWHSLGTVCLQQKEYNKAIKCFKKALRIEKDDVLCLYDISFAYYKNKQRKSALQYFKRAYEIDPKNEVIRKLRESDFRLLESLLKIDENASGFFSKKIKSSGNKEETIISGDFAQTYSLLKTL